MRVSETSTLRTKASPHHQAARHKVVVNSRYQAPSVAATRREIALAVLALIALTAAAALWVPGGMAVFEKLLPVLSLVLGHFFAQR